MNVESNKLTDAVQKALDRGVKPDDIVEITTLAKGGDPDRAAAIRDGKNPDEKSGAEPNAGVNDDGAQMGKHPSAAQKQRK